MTLPPIKEAHMYTGRNYMFLKGKRGISRSVLYIVAAVLSFGVFLTFVNIYELRRLQQEHAYQHAEVEAIGEQHSHNDQRPVVWIHGKKPTSGYLNNVIAVFSNIGYNILYTEPAEWDVLWCHDYPFVQLKKQLSHLKPNQRVNHFPGSGFITNKVNLATSKDIKHIPKAFKMPKDKDALIAFSMSHPDWLWVQKSNNHRGVRIKMIDELDLGKEDSFVQQYIGKPYLIDGKRFDIGVYTTVTSIDPLRVYINEGDFLVRFCPKDYYPFDPTDRDKYVVHDDYYPMWKLPTLQKYYKDLDYSFREALLAHLRSQGYDTDAFMEKLRECIRSVFLSKEQELVKAVKRLNFKSGRQFFEMVRFDFVFDEDLNVYLMEVNMSPNLSSIHFPPNKLLYMQTIFSMLGLVGVARAAHNELTATEDEKFQMQVHEKDIHTYSDICASRKCIDNCLTAECKLCAECMMVQQKLDLKQAYLEHMNRNRWRRVLPRPFKDQKSAKLWKPEHDKQFRNLTSKNKWMALWFHGKCMQDPMFCF